MIGIPLRQWFPTSFQVLTIALVRARGSNIPWGHMGSVIQLGSNEYIGYTPPKFRERPLVGMIFFY